MQVNIPFVDAMGIIYQKTRCLLGWSWCSNCSSGCYIWLDMDHVVEHEKSLICSNPFTMSTHVPTFCMKWSSFTCNFDFQDWSGCFIWPTFPTYTIVHRKKSVNPKKHQKKLSSYTSLDTPYTRTSTPPINKSPTGSFLLVRMDGFFRSRSCTSCRCGLWNFWGWGPTTSWRCRDGGKMAPSWVIYSPIFGWLNMVKST